MGGISSKIHDDTDESESLTLCQSLPVASLTSVFFWNKLKYLLSNNTHRLIMTQINVNSLRNKFDALVGGIQGNIYILIVRQKNLTVAS